MKTLQMEFAKQNESLKIDLSNKVKMLLTEFQSKTKKLKTDIRELEEKNQQL